jgi:hypothetical protein
MKYHTQQQHQNVQFVAFKTAIDLPTMLWGKIMLQNKCRAQDMAGLSVRQPLGLQGINMLKKRRKTGLYARRNYPSLDC